MSIFSRISESMTGSKPKAVAFVDFENWYISLDRLYHRRPDMQAWMTELQKSYNIREIYVFGDFSNQSLRAEIPKIREITNIIIETQNASNYVTKDFTDFIMLDHIYQKALSAHDIKAFIIFSCDGHFSSSVSFLKNQCGKTVEVYGIKGAMSNQLRNTATKCTEIPSEESAELLDQKYYDQIFANLKYLSDNNRGTHRMYPSFPGTVDAVVTYYGSDEEDVSRALRYLIDRDYIYQTEEKVGGRTLKVLNVNWELARREGVYNPDDETADTKKQPAEHPQREKKQVSTEKQKNPTGNSDRENQNKNGNHANAQKQKGTVPAKEKDTGGVNNTAQPKSSDTEKTPVSHDNGKQAKPNNRDNAAAQPDKPKKDQNKRRENKAQDSSENNGNGRESRNPAVEKTDEIDVLGIIGKIGEPADVRPAAEKAGKQPDDAKREEKTDTDNVSAAADSSDTANAAAKKKRRRKRYYHKPKNTETTAPQTSD